MTMLTQAPTLLTRCPTCGETNVGVVFDLDNIPVFCNVLYPNREAALAADTASIHLAFCPTCEMIYNRAFAPERVRYVPGYENSLYFSSHFTDYAEETAHRLIETYNIRGKRVVEIGCGNGDFLRLLKRLGNNEVVGYDPSYSGDSDISIVRTTFSEAHAQAPIDLVCCRHVLEHLPDPRGFLHALRSMLARHPDCLLHFEVPNGQYMLDQGAVWDVLYEHCLYWTGAALRHAFMDAGFEPIEIREQYSRQYLTLEARLHHSSDTVDQTRRKEKGTPGIKTLTTAFGDLCRSKINQWEARWSHPTRREEAWALWGAGSKGVTFLNTVGPAREVISRVVDINPRKQGRFIAGTGQEVIPPEALTQDRISHILITNPVYRLEIAKVLEHLNIPAALLTL